MVRNVHDEEIDVIQLDLTDEKLFHTWLLLKFSYAILFIVVGIDKFINFVVDWQQYVNPAILSTLHLPYSTFKVIIAVIEIAIGLLILTRRTRIGAYLAAGWFFIIALQLILMWEYLDIAARDVLLGIGAIALAWITEILKSEEY